MPSKTGKRAKLPTPCVDCGQKIDASKGWYRDGKKDRCLECGERRIFGKKRD
jgi:DNA-directed RNA polymerase subunit RPC12/RpoP